MPFRPMSSSPLTLDDAEATKSGVNVYGHFMGYGNGAIDPDGSGYMDLYPVL